VPFYKYMSAKGGNNPVKVGSAMLVFSSLQSDLLPRFAARENNVRRIAGTRRSPSIALASHRFA